MRLYPLLWAVLTYSCVGCENHPAPVAGYPDAQFNSAAWKQDSTGCLKYREHTGEGLAQNKAFFRGRPTGYLVQLLGRPSFVVKSKYNGSVRAFYYVIDCTEVPTLKSQGSAPAPTYSLADATTVVFDVRQDTCWNTRLAVP